jgi:hypothetical protein
MTEAAVCHFLGQHDDRTSLLNGRPNQIRSDPCRERIVPVPELALFAVVHASEVITADPLTPAVECQPAAPIFVGLDAGQPGIADEEEVHVVAKVSERLGELRFAGSPVRRLWHRDRAPRSSAEGTAVGCRSPSTSVVPIADGYRYPNRPSNGVLRDGCLVCLQEARRKADATTSA